ncbi:MAG: DMT family transporter [Thermaerobacter sp.]|nr:DMT family transporter [Thermaerobacter sp.]
MQRRAIWLEVGLWLTIVLWALNFLAVKIGVRAFPPALFTALRFLVSAPLLLLLAQRSGGIRVPRREILPLVGTGLLGISVYQMLFTSAVQLTDVASSAILLALSPVFAAIWGAATRKESLRAGNFVGVGLGVIGAALVVLGGSSSPSRNAPAPLLGDVEALLAAITWAAYGFLSLPLVRRLPPLTVTAWQSAFGGIALLPFVPVYWHEAHFSANAFALLYSALPVTVFGLSFWQGATARLGPTRLLAHLSAEPAIAAAAAYFVFGSPLGAAVIGGGIISLLGVYLARAGSITSSPRRGDESVAE